MKIIRIEKCYEWDWEKYVLERCPYTRNTGAAVICDRIDGPSGELVPDQIHPDCPLEDSAKTITGGKCKTCRHHTHFDWDRYLPCATCVRFNHPDNWEEDLTGKMEGEK